MTDAQLIESSIQKLNDVNYERRKFRKECVTRGIVEFVRIKGRLFYEMHYRGCYVCTIFKDKPMFLTLMIVWNAIRIAEKTIKKIEGVKHDCK